MQKSFKFLTRRLKYVILLLATAGLNNLSAIVAQPANEINCFRYFQYNTTGNSRENAYLLSLVNHFNNAPILKGTTDDAAPAVVALHKDTTKFRAEYEKKIKHFFYDPNAAPEIVSKADDKKLLTPNPVIANTNSNKPPVIQIKAYNSGLGYDPEAMIISTDKYIIVCFRGTDRVYNNNPVVGNGIYNFSEWITTNINFLQATPSEGLPGKVHNGFNTAMSFIRQPIEDALQQAGVANKSLWITGHSLGAAMAQLFAVYYKKKKNITPKGVYAYAAPHVGNAEFVEKMNELLPTGILQRFDFMDDPITQLPAYFMGYQRAGYRNLYTKEQGTSNYRYHTNEESFDFDAAKFLFCMHHTEWYSRASFFELIDHRAELNGKIPNAPAKPIDFCNATDYALVNNSLNPFSQGLEDLPEGTYYIRCAQGGKYIDAPYSSADEDGTRVQLYGIGGSLTNNQWRVKKVPGGILGGYTMQCVYKGKYLDADLMGVGSNGCKVQLWGRSVSRVNQEWYIKRLNNGAYLILNVMAKHTPTINKEMMVDAINDCVDENGCKTQLWEKGATTSKTQQWFFIRVE